MIRITLVLVCLLSLAACKEGGLSASSEVTPDGTAYTLIQMPEKYGIAIQVAWATDWAYGADHNQAAPYIGVDLILAGGAEGFPAGEVGERFADLGSQADLSVEVDHILGELKFDNEHMYETVEAANAHLRAPTLHADWFVRLRDGFADTMVERRTQPAHSGFDAARWAVFDDHPVRRALSLDRPRVFDDLTRADIVDWHARTITRNPAEIVISGDIEAEVAGPLIDALLAGLPPQEGALDTAVTPDMTPRRILLHMPEARTTQLSFIGALPPTRLGWEFEDVLIMQALGGDDQSVLFQAARSELGATYGFGAGVANYTREHRLFFMTGEVEAGKLAEAEEVVRAAYDQFVQDGPDGDLEALKRPFAARFSEINGFVDTLSRAALQNNLDGYDVARALGLEAELAAVTGQSIRDRLAQTYPRADALMVIAVSADATALPGACVISSPREATTCQ